MAQIIQGGSGIQSLSPLVVPALTIDTGDATDVIIKVNGKTYVAIEYKGELHFVDETKRKLWEMNKTLKQL